jgi:23S rRNA (uracil1939-C5)-methyltransferase
MSGGAVALVGRVVCEHAERCGGCPLIGLTYEEQLMMKRGRVVQAVARYPALELTYTEPVAPADPVVTYRSRAKLIVAPGGRVGLYAKGGGHQVVDIPRCRVLSPTLASVAEALRQRIARDEASGGVLTPLALDGPGALRALDLRETNDEGKPRVLVTLVMQRERAPAREELVAQARALAAEIDCIAGVAVNFHEGESPQILGGETVPLYGATQVPDRVGKSVHLATFGSFVQAHRGQAERVHERLAQVARETARGRPAKVLDLYGGSGAIALALAAHGADVHLVESFAPAVESARSAASRLGLSLTAEAGDVAGALRGLFEKERRFDLVVVNPPRRGMSPAAREHLARLGAPVVAYVSCEPDTLTRDLDHLVRLGYVTQLLQPLDMIPLTDEVESIAVLRRGAESTTKVLFEDEELVILDKPPHEPTTPQPEFAASLWGRARKLPGAEQAVPLYRIDVGTSGLVMFAKSPDLEKKWQAALQGPNARRVFVAAARGVTPSKGAIVRELREEGRSYFARTRYRRLAVASGHSVLRVIPEQGRTHQVRRHLAAIGHPVLGDDRYGHPPTNRFFEEKNALDRTFLHCVRVEVDHPTTGKKMIVESPLPGDLRAVLERTSGPGTLRFLDHKNALGTSTSTLPPPPDSRHERGSILDIDSSSPTLRPEMVGDDADD